MVGIFAWAWFFDRATAGFDASWYMRQRLLREGSIDRQRQAIMCAHNSKYILRNYLARQAIAEAQQGNFSESQRLLEMMRRPYDKEPDQERYAVLLPDWAQSIEVSCSLDGLSVQHRMPATCQLALSCKRSDALGRYLVVASPGERG